jgi:hypothetical protein
MHKVVLRWFVDTLSKSDSIFLTIWQMRTRRTYSMGRSLTVFVVSLGIILSAVSVSATPLRIVSGYIYLGGDPYNSPDYQTFLDFDVVTRSVNPSREIRPKCVQPFSVFLDHPLQPDGPYSYSVRMPYGPCPMTFNGEQIFPVWYVETSWNIHSSIVTPDATINSPTFVTLKAPFKMAGSLQTYGNLNIGKKMVGSGTVTMTFEKVQTKYFFFDAAYSFSGS